MRRPSLDLRALAVFRIAFSLLLLTDLARWLGDFRFFFTSEGPLPLAALAVDVSVGKDAWSLYNASSYALAPHLLFGLTVATTLAVGLGWRCRVSSPLLFVLMLSLQNRVPVALDQADGWVLALLAVGAFAPWDKALVIARVVSPGQTQTSHPAALSLGLIALAIGQSQAVLSYQQSGFSVWSLLWFVSPALFLAGPGTARNGFAILLALFFLLFVPGPGLMPWLAAASLSVWFSFDRQARVSTSVGVALLVTAILGGLALAVTGGGAQSASLSASPTSPLAAFCAFGPRAAEVSPDVWYVPVAIGADGARWTISRPDQKPDLGRPSHPYVADSYRKRLYLGALPPQRNWGLRYWLAFHTFALEQSRLSQGKTRLQRVEIYQCRPPASSTLFARWPMTD